MLIMYKEPVHLYLGFLLKRSNMELVATILLIVFLLWGLPLTFYRSRFRKLAYKTNSWVINIKPVFGTELKALFGDLFPGNQAYYKARRFYRFYLVVYLVLASAYFGLTHSSIMNTKVEVGSSIPSFSLFTQNGELFDIQSVLGKKKLVIYFYPKDDTPGCTAEACAFRDQFEDFEQAGAMVIGISGQSVESHKSFALKHRLNFTLLSDTGNKVRKLFGVPTSFLGLLPGRVTYVVGLDGKVVYVFNSQLNAQAHVEKSVEILKQL